MKQHSLSYQHVPRETFSAVDKLIENHRSSLTDYLDQLLWWNRRVNLVSRDVPRETVWEHIRHSLLLTQLGCYKNSDFIVDAGTGGGLPGMPLAIVSPEKAFVLNDIATKKVLAVKQMAKKMELKNIDVFDGSIKDLTPEASFLLVSKHAFKIGELYKFTSHLPWLKMVLYKGLDFENEIGSIDDSLTVKSHNLSGEPEFYKNKGIIVISRNH